MDWMSLLMVFLGLVGGNDVLGGYDLGSKNLFAGFFRRFDVESKPIRLGATWFQRGNHVLLEGTVNFDAFSQYPRLYAS